MIPTRPIVYAVAVYSIVLLGVGRALWLQSGEMPTPPAPPFELVVHAHMEECPGPGSAARRALIRERIAAVAPMYLEGDGLSAYLYMVCKESRFDPSAVSPAGARGLTQIMPAYADEFATRAGLPIPLTTADLHDVEVSVRLGAAQLAHLIRTHSGSTTRALIAYNSGPWSAASKAAARGVHGGRVEGEAADYAARWGVARDATLRGVARDSSRGKSK